MKGWSIRSGTIVLAGMLVQQGCLFKKSPPKASIVIPPAPQPQAPQPLPTPPQLSAPQANTGDRAAQLPAPPTLPPPDTPTQPVKPRPARRHSPANAAGTEASVPTHPEAPIQSVPLPALGPSLQPILGSREIHERNQRIQSYLDKARLIVLRAERSPQDEPQKQLIEQVRTFLQQAEDARKVDLMRAENLAERAEVLSRGLVK